uniref:PPM-type phosphatase domain-containing protein n=1 Tax=Kalanchoe fedtschenkoi TaxID=63787 RepID=A0A7N0ZXL1_KALFE
MMKKMDNSSLDMKGSDCLVGLECLLNVARAFGMGSCLSAEVTSAIPSSTRTPTSSSLGKRKSTSRNRSGMRRNLSHVLKRDDLLRRIPGRKFLNSASEVASLFTKQGKKGINQDAMICWENFGSKADTIFCGVFDGHGPFGHMVSKRVRDSLPSRLNAEWELNCGNKEGFSDISSRASGSMMSEEIPISAIDDKLGNLDQREHEDCTPENFRTLRDSFLTAFKVMDKELKLHPSIDCFCSGTTAVTLIKKGRDLMIGNVGDSRAVLGTRNCDNTITAVQLTVDHKPNLPREEERIKKFRGRVHALHNEPEVTRVWLPNNDAPGLAMARAFGDFCLKDYGLISVPEISYHCITEKDEFVVLATDGVWDVLSNKEVVEIVASVARSSAAQTLVESAVKAWKYKHPTSKVDDCAVICLFFDSNSCSSSSSRGVN